MWRFIFYAGLLLPALAWAQPIIENENIPGSCEPTPTIPGASGSYPGQEKIVPSNKVAIPAGKAVFARGEVLYLQGRVLDEGCVPVENVSIELWQTDTEGKYRREKPGDLASPAPVFAGSGHAFSNNQGEYKFITVFPGTYAKRAPHIHLRISHADFSVLSTEVFFEGDHRNATDSRLKTLKPGMRERLMAKMASSTAPLIARFDIVLKGKSKFKHY